MLKFFISYSHEARGIVAEPPSASEAKREGDGADSPTRAPEGREAARPNIFKYKSLFEQNAKSKKPISRAIYTV
jgi:hypothetical protein